nr:hypothetical protein CFP56_18759 [Quercus suber]
MKQQLKQKYLPYGYEDEIFEKFTTFRQGRMLIIDGDSDMNVVSEATVDRLKLPTEPLPKPYKPQKEVEELEQDADKSEKFAKMVEQPDEQLMDPKQQVQQSTQHATKSMEPEEQVEESNQQTKTSQQLEDDLKHQLTSLMEETL